MRYPSPVVVEELGAAFGELGAVLPDDIERELCHHKLVEMSPESSRVSRSSAWRGPSAVE
jgi:hypothetical protein